MNRDLVLVGCLVGLLLTAGCVDQLEGFASGDESLSYTAGEIGISEEAVSESPYTLASDESFSFDRSIEAAGQSRSVELNTHMLHLKRSYQGAPLASVVILSVPQVEALGQQINITERVGLMSLVGQAQSSSGELEQQQKLGQRSVRMLGENRTVEVFSGTAKQEGESAKAKIHVATFDHSGDTIVAVGIVPQVAEDEGSAVLNLLESVQYEG